MDKLLSFTLLNIVQNIFSMNEMYAPYLPADEVGSATIDSYIRMLDKRYSLEPLIRALNIVQRRISLDETLPREIVQKIGVNIQFFFVFCFLT